MLRLADFSYQLPETAIAQSPAEPRDSSKLLVVDRESGALEHHVFHDLVELVGPNDVLVRNNTQVMPARLFGIKNTGGGVEVLLTKRVAATADREVWECLTKPGLKVNQAVVFDNYLSAIVNKVTGYTRELIFYQGGVQFLESLNAIGHTPLPPYIKWNQDDESELREIYQTTYAKVMGSVAAPTAGLHFTPELDKKIRAKGVQIEEVTLHVGLGTFLPVKNENVTDHTMHSEWFALSADTADRLNQAKHQGKRIIAVGTTTCRVLESCTDSSTGLLTAHTGETDIFIYPPYQFRFIDSLITNFHLPESTLLMLISAFASQPNTSHPFSSFRESILGKAYQTAIDNNYRFFSFGDAMWIV